MAGNHQGGEDGLKRTPRCFLRASRLVYVSTLSSIFFTKPYN